MTGSPKSPATRRVASDRPFLVGMALLGGSYLFIIAAMVLADLVFLDYRDQPVYGPEVLDQGRYAKDGSPLEVPVEPGRLYHFQMGNNESTLANGKQVLEKTGTFQAKSGKVVLHPDPHPFQDPKGEWIGRQPKDIPITASIRAEAHLATVTVEDGHILFQTDIPHGRIWGEFIRITSPLDAINGVHEIVDTHKTRLSIALPEGVTSSTKLPQPDQIQLTRPNPLVQAIRNRDIQFSIQLSLISCTITTLLSLWVAIPIGYLLTRYQFRYKGLIDILLDIPIVLPPLVVGLSLLILFRYVPEWLSDAVVYKWPAVILAQFMVACAFAVRTLRVTFEQIPQRYEQVALTLGCNRQQAFWRVILPQAKGGILAAGTLAWARSLGEFGPILVFAGATRQKTEVLPTSAFLELQAGRTEGMLAVSLIMIAAATLVFIFARSLGMKRLFS